MLDGGQAEETHNDAEPAEAVTGIPVAISLQILWHLGESTAKLRAEGGGVVEVGKMVDAGAWEGSCNGSFVTSRLGLV